MKINMCIWSRHVIESVFPIAFFHRSFFNQHKDTYANINYLAFLSRHIFIVCSRGWLGRSKDISFRLWTLYLTPLQFLGESVPRRHGHFDRSARAVIWAAVVANPFNKSASSIPAFPLPSPPSFTWPVNFLTYLAHRSREDSYPTLVAVVNGSGGVC